MTTATTTTADNANTNTFHDRYLSLLSTPTPRPDSVRKVLAICNAFFRVYLSEADIDMTKRIIARDAVINLGVNLDDLKHGLELGELNVKDWIQDTAGGN